MGMIEQAAQIGQLQFGYVDWDVELPQTKKRWYEVMEQVRQLFEPKPDEGSRLLRDEEIKQVIKDYWANQPLRNRGGYARTTMEKYNAIAKAQLAQDEAHIEALIDLIGDLADAGECVLDHHGDCQAHGYTKPCPMPEAHRVYKEFKATHTSKEKK